MPQRAQEPPPPAFEEVVERLEAIAQKLERGDTKLEEAVALFEEGVGLAKLGTQRLDEAERKLEILMAGDKAAPFNADAEQ